MEKYMYHAVNDEDYLGIVTVLDYETTVSACLSDMSFPSDENSGKRILIDAALKAGMNQYRFLEATVSCGGKPQAKTMDCVQPAPALEAQANRLLSERMDIVRDSMLPGYKKRELEKL